MIDLYLKAKHELELFQSLPFLKWRDEYHPVQSTKDYSLDIIGSLYDGEPQVTIDEKSGEAVSTPAKKLSGFHANLRCTEEIAKQVPEFLIVSAPKTPKREWL